MKFGIQIETHRDFGVVGFVEAESRDDAAKKLKLRYNSTDPVSQESLWLTRTGLTVFLRQLPEVTSYEELCTRITEVAKRRNDELKRVITGG